MLYKVLDKKRYKDKQFAYPYKLVAYRVLVSFKKIVSVSKCKCEGVTKIALNNFK